MINIGNQIRELRKKRGITLTQMSEKSGVQLSTLSRIETGRMAGTIKSRTNIAKALDMSLAEFYGEMEKTTVIQKKDDYADLFIHDKKTSSVILIKDIFTKKMLPVLIELEPGGRIHQEQFKKGAEKFMYILNGKVEVVIGEERHTLKKGASLYFDASYKHYVRNLEHSLARCICVLTPVIL